MGVRSPARVIAINARADRADGDLRGSRRSAAHREWREFGRKSASWGRDAAMRTRETMERPLISSSGTPFAIRPRKEVCGLPLLSFHCLIASLSKQDVIATQQGFNEALHPMTTAIEWRTDHAKL
jgi:hypothetical protein